MHVCIYSLNSQHVFTEHLLGAGLTILTKGKSFQLVSVFRHLPQKIVPSRK